MTSRSKESLHAAEQERADVRIARANLKQEQPRLDPKKLIFIDETGTSTNMTRLRGRAARGQRLLAKVPHGHWKMTTFVAALRADGITAPFVIDAPMNGEIFVTYLQQCVVPTLSPGEIVSMDNLLAHKVAACAKPSRRPAQNCGCCQPTLPISTPLSSPSQNSKRICERPANDQFPPSGIGSEPSSKHSRRRNAKTISLTPDTGQTEGIPL